MITDTLYLCFVPKYHWLIKWLLVIFLFVPIPIHLLFWVGLILEGHRNATDATISMFFGLFPIYLYETGVEKTFKDMEKQRADVGWIFLIEDGP